MSEEILNDIQNFTLESGNEADNEGGQSEQTNEEEIPVSKEQKRIDELVAQKAALTRQKYEERRKADQLKYEHEQLKREIESLKQKPDNNGDIDIDALVTQRALEIEYNRTFDKACNDVYQAGIKEYGEEQFNHSINNLSMIGLDRDTLDLITSADNGEKILAHLGQNLDEADRILNLPPLKLAREITKLEALVSIQKKKTVSNAPEPFKAVSGSKGGANKNPADMTDAEYAKWRRGK